LTSWTVLTGSAGSTGLSAAGFASAATLSVSCAGVKPSPGFTAATCFSPKDSAPAPAEYDLPPGNGESAEAPNMSGFAAPHLLQNLASSPNIVPQLLQTKQLTT